MTVFDTIGELRQRVSWKVRRTVSHALGQRKIALRSRGAVISFTFDDFPKSAFEHGSRILEANGVRGTYFVAFGLLGEDSPSGRICDRQDVLDLAAAGHELGSHTYAHDHSWNTDGKTFEGSVVKNATALDELIPGAKFSSLAYPISVPRPGTKRRMGQHFRCCRSEGQTYNLGHADLNSVRACFIEQLADPVGDAKLLIDQVCERGGWLVFATHDICERPSRFGCSIDAFSAIVRYSVASGASVLPMSAALESVAANGQP